jgi:hypothetical protein
MLGQATLLRHSRPTVKIERKEKKLEQRSEYQFPIVPNQLWLFGGLAGKYAQFGSWPGHKPTSQS